MEEKKYLDPVDAPSDTSEGWRTGFYNPYSKANPTPTLSTSLSSRVIELDLARGVAIALMILSHGVKGLVSFEVMPAWGIMPVHMLTKFSSTLFFFVFGMTLGLFFLPHADTNKWPEKRNWLLFRGLEVLFWYKILIVVQMFQTFPRKEIVDTLLFRRSSDFVEVLGFYSIFMLWIPFMLPLWKNLKLFGRLATLAGFLAVTHFGQSWDWGSAPTKAIFVETGGFYTFGQFARGWIVILGLLASEVVTYVYQRKNGRLFLCLMFWAGSLVSFSIFLFFAQNNIYTHLFEIGKNIGKHPPDLIFTSFSFGGALLILGSAFITNQAVQKLLTPISMIGRYSLQAFIFHICVIFIAYRWLFDLKHQVKYETALLSAIGLIGITAIWTGILKWRKNHF